MMTEKIEKLPIEATTAAKWWADRLRYGAKQQMVSPDQRVLRPGSTADTDIMEVLTLRVSKDQQVLSPQQIDEFESILAEIVVKRFIETDGWQKAKSNPIWGSASRILSVDYGACCELRAAYQAAGGGHKSTSVFPIKTIMWINPGSVKLQYGYGSAEEELIGQKPIEPAKTFSADGLIQLHWQNYRELNETLLVAQGGEFGSAVEMMDWINDTLRKHAAGCPAGWGPLICDSTSSYFWMQAEA